MLIRFQFGLIRINSHLISIFIASTKNDSEDGYRFEKDKVKDASRKRHIAKAITWRCIGTLDTILLSWFITGDPFIGLQIGLAEVLTKMVLYYLHERIWFRINLGDTIVSQWRHILKTISWRVVGTIDTMLLAWMISGNPMVGIKVGIVEVVTKMLLYYLHERAWYRVNYGLTSRKSNSKIADNE